jgi:SOS-response transcriptional repressor LexA
MITKQQRKALLFIEAEMERTGGVAPSVREIADHFHYRSPTMARRLLIGLEERGFIRRLEGKDRAVEVLLPSVGSRLSVLTAGPNHFVHRIGNKPLLIRDGRARMLGISSQPGLARRRG